MKFQEKQSKEIAKTVLKGLFGAVPYIGDLLNEVIFEHRSRIKQDRLNEFIKKLSEYFEANSEVTMNINSDNLKSEEFSDVFERILYSASKTSAEHKLNIFRNILVKRIESENTSIDLENLYIDITNSISEIQYIILLHFASLSDDDLFIPVKFEIDRWRRHSYNLNIPGYTARDRREKNRVLYERWKTIEDPNDPNTYSIVSDDFLISVTDLISKGLLLIIHTRTNSLKRINSMVFQFLVESTLIM